MKYTITLTDDSHRIVVADRDALQPSGAVIFLSEKKTPEGNTILLPEKEGKQFDTVLVLSPTGYHSYEPVPDVKENIFNLSAN